MMIKKKSRFYKEYLSDSQIVRNSLLLFSCVQFFVTLWTTTCQASLSFTITRNLLKLMSTELVMPSKHPLLCCPLLLLPSIFPNIRVFSNELALHIRWPKYQRFNVSIVGASASACWSFSFNIQHWKERQSFQWIFRIDFL